jgi:hypothetical protein
MAESRDVMPLAHATAGRLEVRIEAAIHCH